MEEPGNQRAFGQVLVDLHGFAGLGHVYRDGTPVQIAAGVWVNVQLVVHALGEHDVEAPRVPREAQRSTSGPRNSSSNQGLGQEALQDG